MAMLSSYWRPHRIEYTPLKRHTPMRGPCGDRAISIRAAEDGLASTVQAEDSFEMLATGDPRAMHSLLRVGVPGLLRQRYIYYTIRCRPTYRSL